MLSVLLSLVLTAASALLHFECLMWLNDRLPRARLIERRAKVVAAIAGALISHLLQIVLFAAAYYLLRDRLLFRRNLQLARPGRHLSDWQPAPGHRDRNADRASHDQLDRVIHVPRNEAILALTASGPG